MLPVGLLAPDAGKVARVHPRAAVQVRHLESGLGRLESVASLRGGESVCRLERSGSCSSRWWRNIFVLGGGELGWRRR